MESAAEISSRVRTGRLSAIDVTRTALERAEAAHDRLNAFTLIDVGGAMRRAEAIDELVRAGRDPGPLAGVPVALKDIIDDAGVPNTKGSAFPATVAESSATVVRRLGANGAVVIARTGLHEFAFGFTSENPWFGPVRNPWDVATSAGGSSGGSAAVVAAGAVPIGIGTDTGGSVRVPAAMCGVMGLKVTHGRIPLTGVHPLVESLDTVGPIARTIEDLTLAYLAMAGDDPNDPWAQPIDVDEPEPLAPSSIRLGIVRQWLEPPMSSEVRRGLDDFRDRCADHGIDVSDVDEPVLAPDPSLQAAIGPEIVAVHGDRYQRHPDRYGADVAERIEAAHSATAGDVLAANRWAAGARAAVARHHRSGVTALVSPTVGVMRKAIGTPTVSVDGTAVFHRQAMARFTAPINRMGVPALSVPVMGTGGPGVSVQLVGPMWSESILLALGAALETAGIVGSPRPPITVDDPPPHR